MKNMNNKTKKWIAVAGGLALCAVLVTLIGRQFRIEKPADAPLPSQSQVESDVTVDNGNPEKEMTVQKPEITQPESIDSSAVSTGTEQTIQGDVTKPQEPEPPKTEDGKDKTPKPQTPEKPKPADNKDETPSEDKNHDFTPESPDAPPAYKPEETEKKPVEQKPSGGGNSIPGFDNVPDGGANQVIEVDGDGDINKQVGTMD